MRERGRAQPQSREPIRRQRTELEKKFNIKALLVSIRFRDTHFLSVFAPPHQPTAANHVTTSEGSRRVYLEPGPDPVSSLKGVKTQKHTVL